jgi:hypothetical protein
MNTNYNPISAGIKGAVAYMAEDHTVTMTAAADIGFGVAVTSAGAQVSATSDLFGGVVRMQSTLVTGVGFKANDPLPILTKGAIWVQVSEAVAVGELAYATADGLKFNKTPGNVTTGGVFRTAASTDGLAILEINLPIPPVAATVVIGG